MAKTTKKLATKDLLRKVAVNGVKPNGKPKKDRPTLSGHETEVDKLVSMKKEMEDLKRKYEQLEESVIEAVKDVYDDVRKAGNYQTAIFAEGQHTNGAMFIFPDRFCNIDAELEDELRNLDNDYDKHFVEVRELKLKKDAGKTVSDATIDMLRAKLGDELFVQIFDIKVHIGAQKGLAERWDELPDEVKEMVRQVKASLRNVTDDGKVV